jgi:hypothetical protein
MRKRGLIIIFTFLFLLGLLNLDLANSLPYDCSIFGTCRSIPITSSSLSCIPHDCGLGNCIQSTVGGYICVPCGVGGNSSWNESRANNIYYPINSNPSSYCNSTNGFCGGGLSFESDPIFTSWQSQFEPVLVLNNQSNNFNFNNLYNVSNIYFSDEYYCKDTYDFYWDGGATCFAHKDESSCLADPNGFCTWAIAENNLNSSWLDRVDNKFNWVKENFRSIDENFANSVGGSILGLSNGIWQLSGDKANQFTENVRHYLETYALTISASSYRNATIQFNDAYGSYGSEGPYGSITYANGNFDFKSGGQCIDTAVNNPGNPEYCSGYGDESSCGYAGGCTWYNASTPGITANGEAIGGGSQTPWTSDIDGAGYNLNNVGTITMYPYSANLITTSAGTLTFQQTGASFGVSSLTIANGVGTNGAIFSTAGSNVDVVDFIFQTDLNQRNIRYESRGGYTSGIPAPVFHIGGISPDNPELAVGDNITAVKTQLRVGTYNNDNSGAVLQVLGNETIRGNLNVTLKSWFGDEVKISTGTIINQSGVFTNKIHATTSDPKLNVLSPTNWDEIKMLDIDVPRDKKGDEQFFDGKNEFHWNALTGDYFALDFLNRVVETGNVKSLGILKTGYFLDYQEMQVYKKTYKNISIQNGSQFKEIDISKTSKASIFDDILMDVTRTFNSICYKLDADKMDSIAFNCTKTEVIGTSMTKQLKPNYQLNSTDGKFYEEIPIYITQQIEDIPIRVGVNEAVE